jgi:hypothetical protein
LNSGSDLAGGLIELLKTLRVGKSDAGDKG